MKHATSATRLVTPSDAISLLSVAMGQRAGPIAVATPVTYRTGGNSHRLSSSVSTRGWCSSALCLLLMLGIICASGNRALARERFDIMNFRPAAGQSRGFISFNSATVLHHLGWEAGFVSSYANNPLVLISMDGLEQVKIIGEQLSWHFLFSLGLFDLFEFNLDVPIVYWQKGASFSPVDYVSRPGSCFGDIRFSTLASLLSTSQNQQPKGFSLGLVANLYLPTGNSEEFLGEGAVRFEPGLVAELALDSARFGLYLGYLMRPDTEYLGVSVGDMLTFGLAAELALSPALSVVPNLFGRVSMESEEILSANLPLEGIIALKLRPTRGLTLELGIGGGIVAGIGTPNWRGLLGLTWTALRSSTRP